MVRVEGKSRWVVPSLLLVIGMTILAGEVYAALQCYDCHGARAEQDVRPQDASFRNPSSGGFIGNHRTHMGSAATANTCNNCHPGSTEYKSSHRNGYIKVSSKINSSPSITTYKNQTSAFLQTADPTSTLGSCSSVNCHFEKTTPNWGNVNFESPNDCSKCHEAPPTDGSHLRKHNSYYGTGPTSCSWCHADHLSPVNQRDRFAHATSIGRRQLAIQFNKFPNTGGTYSGYSGNLSGILPSQRTADKRNGTCTTVYCHSDGRGGVSNIALPWSGSKSSNCYSCHRGQTADSTEENCYAIGGNWSSAKGYCTPDLTMSSNGHHRLVGPQWIRKYPCEYCHADTVDTFGNISGAYRRSNHIDGKRTVVMAAKWNIAGRPMASYSASSSGGVCKNVYCHSDGTTDPEDVRPFPWTEPKTDCNACHGHPTGSCDGCHNGTRKFVINNISTILRVLSGWPLGQEWMGALPMFPNEGPGKPRANSHPRHAQTNFSCDECHRDTISVGGGSCQTDVCHQDGKGIPSGSMSEVSHINANFHVNKTKDVSFKLSGTWDKDAKTCSGTGNGKACHAGNVPVWGGSASDSVVCLDCHGTTGGDIDVYGGTFGTHSTAAKINTTEWYRVGHGRYSSNGPVGANGPYPKTNNPAANFGGNPCWYCHDPNVLHNYSSNPFRLRHHQQYEKRFEKECAYCHMQGTVLECLSCHVGQTESLSPQATANGIVYRYIDNSTKVTLEFSRVSSSITTTINHTYVAGCMDSGCHVNDDSIHKTGSNKLWNVAEKKDIKNQYVMMGVCLQCHDDDSSNQCISCHKPPADNPLKYSIGFNPGLPKTRFVKPKKARASSGHFGYKHYKAYEKDGVWKGGKFCWDCHDPHGDTNSNSTSTDFRPNIYMIQREVATTTDGTHGKPLTRSSVVFENKNTGKDYANSDKTKPYNGICNVCHSPASKHFTSNSGDQHNDSRVCTTCHEHRFADSHANKQVCTKCHNNSKPVPKHAAFGLPRDCTKCHAGIIGDRMDVMTQLKAKSHHIQGVEVNNNHCYPCHWESTKDGLIDLTYHEGYNYKIYTSVKNAKVDLVIAKSHERPTVYSNHTTVVQFTAKLMGTANEREEAAKISTHCISCHSDQNNDWMPFDDCKTPRQYAWDSQSIAARYSQPGKTTTWGKINPGTYPNANTKYAVTKAFSAHGNAAANTGGWNKSTGVDSAISNRTGTKNVECFDCHSSHGSTLLGTTSSYLTFNNTKNGGNLKETQAGKGGYTMTYKAKANTTPGAVNPYKEGAGQCFDCHNSKIAGTTPWGYSSTFGSVSSIKGYMDSDKFGGGANGVMGRSPGLKALVTGGIKGGHLKRSSDLTKPVDGTIDGLCTPCHDPHGVTPTLGEADQHFAVPLLKGTWMTSPYKEDYPPNAPSGTTAIPPNTFSGWETGRNNVDATNMKVKYNIDRITFNDASNTTRIPQSDYQFAGLCMRCHSKKALLGNYTGAVGSGSSANKAPWKSVERIHAATKGWGQNKEHSFTCSKCHTPHTSGLPRLMITDCLDYSHRGNVTTGGQAWSADNYDITRLSGYQRPHNHTNHRGYPIANILGNSPTAEAFTACHISRDPAPAYNPVNKGTWPAGNLWNEKTPWGTLGN